MKQFDLVKTIKGHMTVMCAITYPFTSNIGKEFSRESILYWFQDAGGVDYWYWDRELNSFLTEESYNVLKNAG